MARVPWIVTASFGAQFLPLAVGLVRWRVLTPARRWVLAWLGLLAFMNILSLYTRNRGINNHFLTYVFTPFQGALILWGLSLWQLRPVARLTMRLAIPFFVLAWAILTLTVENTRSFSAAAEPVYSLLALGAAIFTLVARGADAAEALTRQDWFWICTGLSLHFGALAVMLPLAAGLVTTQPDVVIRAYIVRSVVNIIAILCLTIGFLCPTPLTRSGASFSPAS